MCSITRNFSLFKHASILKIHRNLCLSVADALERIFGPDGAYADKVLEAVLRSDRRYGARDRAFIAENTYEIVRHARLLGAVLGHEPVSAADWLRVLGIRLLLTQEEPLPDFPEWQGLEREAVLKKHAELQSVRALRESVPDWLDELGVAELGERWDDLLAALNRPAPVALRVNTLKTDRDTALQNLAAEEIECTPAGDAGLLLVKRSNVFRSKAFQSGQVEVQDISSQEVAPFLDVAPGMCVIDACAGGGGKTLHLAALLHNKGRLIALDTEGWKLDELRKRAKRAGAHCIETRTINSSKVIKRLHGAADRLLLDVPCTGLGVLRRNPDAKWKLRPEQLESLRQTQYDILTQYARMVRSGGQLVYATCSILPSENERQVERFLAEDGKDFQLLQQQTIAPGDGGGDGFFMALLKKA
jgi:16S rRNA (cytosine967-C5)-methyltransferase